MYPTAPNPAPNVIPCLTNEDTDLAFATGITQPNGSATTPPIYAPNADLPYSLLANILFNFSWSAFISSSPKPTNCFMPL